MQLLPHMTVPPICHGTSSKYVKAILKNGIVPRKISGLESNWKEYASKETMVYLSTAYPFYFANTVCEKDEMPAIFQIDLSKLNKRKFFPDEDFIVQALSRQMNVHIDKIHFEIRDNLKKYKKYWLESLNGLGNMAYAGTIPVEAIVRYAVVDRKKRPGLSMFMDPCISMINYSLMGGTYQRFTNWILGLENEFPPLQSAREDLKAAESAPDKSFANMFRGLVENYEREGASRDGIELVDLSPVNAK